jgi:phenylacetate-CoA ligase
MSLYGDLVGAVLFPLWESGVRRRPTLGLLADLVAGERTSLDELRARQSAALRRLARHAFEQVPFYRRRFEAAGLDPDDVCGVEDLARLPVVTRDELRDAGRDWESVGEPRPTIRKSTSGTMGKPLVFGYEPASEHWRQAVKLRGYGWAGYRVGRRALHYWGAGRPGASHLARWKTTADHKLKRERYVDCTRRSRADLDAVAALVARERPEALLCYSQAGADLARHVLEGDLRRWGTIPVLCGAEKLTGPDRAALEAAFGPAVFETYGCREVMLIATECEAHAGLHVSMENLVVEVLGQDGEPARPGELGKVVVTDLHNFGMPFIRYANGDLAVAGPEARCPCGRTLPRLASIEGRITDALLDGAGRRVNGLVFNVVIAHLAHGIRQFQVVQRRDRAITVRIVPTARFDDGIRQTLRETCERYLPGTPVSLDLVSEIPAGAGGKRQVVVVE